MLHPPAFGDPLIFQESRMNIPFTRSRLAIVCLLTFSAATTAAPLGSGGNLANLFGLNLLGGRTTGSTRGPLGVTILQDGVNGSGVGNVLELGNAAVIANQLDNIGTPLLGLDG